MSQENVEIVLGMLRDWTGGNRDAARAVIAEDIVFRILPIDIGAGAGRIELERGLEGWRQTWEDFSLVPGEVIDVGDRVFVVMRQQGRGRESGAEVERQRGTIGSPRRARWFEG